MTLTDALAALEEQYTGSLYWSEDSIETARIRAQLNVVHDLRELLTAGDE